MKLRRSRVLLLSILIAGACLLLTASHRRLSEGNRLRIGSNQSLPFNFFDAGGQPIGFAVEVIERAAARAGYKLEWIRTSLAPEEALHSGLVDVWPFLTETPARKKVLYLTRPWWSSSTALYFLRQRPVAAYQDLENRTIVYGHRSIRSIEGLDFPASTQHRFAKDTEGAFVDLCRGDASVVWADPRYAELVLLERPRECEGVAIGTTRLPNSARTFSTATTSANTRIAERLRESIDALAEDGEIVEIALRWKVIQETDSTIFEWISKRSRNQMVLRLMLGALGVLLLISMVFVRRLQIARSMAETSALARSRFLATMSHEIRTPMNGILGMTELALQGNLTEPERGFLNAARDSAQSLLGILNDILDFSRAESGQMKLESLPFSARELAQRSLRGFQEAAKEKSIQLEVALDPLLPAYLWGDPGRLQQVLLNLVGNAVKFTAQGSVTLTIRRAAVPKGGKEAIEFTLIQFQVRDTGIGIPREQHERIFDAFTQADPSTTRRFGGTGLGLSISRKLVRLMGGELTLESMEGEGSVFSFILPFGLAETPLEPEAPVAQAACRPLDILIVDDNPVNRALMRGILDRAGHKTEMADDGLAALALLYKKEFDAVLMDVHMPELDGMQATAKFREWERSSQKARTPVIALTALAMPGDAERCMKAGMDAYLSKPIVQQQLFALLRQVAAKPNTPTVVQLR